MQEIEVQVASTPPNIKRDLSGLLLGRLHVLGFSKWKYYKKRDREPLWWCKCECGTIKEIKGGSLKSGATKSCGCLHKSRVTKHGLMHTPAWVSYYAAKARCNNKTSGSYRYYGGRGVRFLLPNFEVFLEIMGQPAAGESLDRINTNGDYEIGNVKWSNTHEQANNKRSNLKLEIDGVVKTVSEWCRGNEVVNRTMVANRIHLGWCGPCALSIPAFGGKCTHKRGVCDGNDK